MEKTQKSHKNTCSAPITSAPALCPSITSPASCPSPQISSSFPRSNPQLLHSHHSTSNLLSVNYNPSQNPKKDAIVQTASIRILEVEALLDKIDSHIDKHHRRSSHKLKDFEQIHSELSQIQTNLIRDDYAAAASLDPFIVISTHSPSTTPKQDADSESKDDEKDEAKEQRADNGSANTPTVHSVHHNTLTHLLPFQSLVQNAQNELFPDTFGAATLHHSPSSDAEKEPLDLKHDDHLSPSIGNSLSPHSLHSDSPSITLKKSELESIQEHVKEHRDRMKEKTYQYEEKKRQLQSAKERLDKAKARFRRRLHRSKVNYRSRALSDTQQRSRAFSDTPQTTRSTKTNVHALSTSDMTNRSFSACHTINENSSATPDVSEPTSPLRGPTNMSLSPEMVSTSPKKSVNLYNAPYAPYTSKSGPLFTSIPSQHTTIPTNSSVASSISSISDQSFVDEFQSINAELENIDFIVRNQVRSTSMTSLLSDFGFDPKRSGSPVMVSEAVDSDEHIKNNTTSYSQLSQESNKQHHFSGYVSNSMMEHSDLNSLRSDLSQLQDIENQIAEL